MNLETKTCNYFRTHHKFSNKNFNFAQKKSNRRSSFFLYIIYTAMNNAYDLGSYLFFILLTDDKCSKTFTIVDKRI